MHSKEKIYFLLYIDSKLQKRYEKYMPLKKIKNYLRKNNLRPTKQRIAIFDILFSDHNWHFSADTIQQKCFDKGIKISAGTIYNVLNDFHAKGLISKVMIDDDRAWFDTNTSDHFHVYDTNNNILFDIEPKDISLSLPKKIKASEIKNIEILIKI